MLLLTVRNAESTLDSPLTFSYFFFFFALPEKILKLSGIKNISKSHRKLTVINWYFCASVWRIPGKIQIFVLRRNGIWLRDFWQMRNSYSSLILILFSDLYYEKGAIEKTFYLLPSKNFFPDVNSFSFKTDAEYLVLKNGSFGRKNNLKREVFFFLTPLKKF